LYNYSAINTAVNHRNFDGRNCY